MSMTPDQILDRYKLKAQLSKWRICAFIVLALLLWVLSLNKDMKSVKSHVYSAHIARITIDGIILESHERDKILREIRKNDSVKALIVHVDSPGGSVVGGETLYHALRKIAARKPVVIVMRESATSAAYMAALGGTYILAREGTITGSVGVLTQSFELTDLAKKVGIELHMLKTSPYKAAPNQFEKLTPEIQTYIQEVLHDSQQMFLRMLKSSRKLSDADIAVIGEGKIYTGGQALKLGLIDGIGDEEDAVEWLVSNKKLSRNLEIREVPLYVTQPLEKLEKYLDSISNFLIFTKSASQMLWSVSHR